MDAMDPMDSVSFEISSALKIPEENRTPSKRQKVDSTSDLNSEIDGETLYEKETDEDNNLEEEQKISENEIQENSENNFLEEFNPGDPEVELIANNLIEEHISAVEKPAV